MLRTLHSRADLRRQGERHLNYPRHASAGHPRRGQVAADRASQCHRDRDRYPRGAGL